MVDIEQVLRGVVTWDTDGKNDVYPIVEHPTIRDHVLDELVKRVDDGVDRVAAIETTGIVFGSMLAGRLGKGFVAVRREGKWPYTSDKLLHGRCRDYSGKEKTFVIREDEVREGEDLLLFDDWMETGSQYRCVKRLLERRGNVAQSLFLAVEDNDDTAGIIDGVDALMTVR